MRPDLLQVLKLIAVANDRGSLALADRYELIAACEELFDLGYLAIMPPGHRYRVNVAGRAALAAATPPAADAPLMARQEAVA